MSAATVSVRPAAPDYSRGLHLALTQESPDVRLTRRVAQGFFAAATLLPPLGAVAISYLVAAWFFTYRPAFYWLSMHDPRPEKLGPVVAALLPELAAGSVESVATLVIAMCWLLLVAHLVPLLLLALDRPFTGVPALILLALGAGTGQPGPMLTLLLSAPAACVWLTMLAIDASRRAG